MNPCLCHSCNTCPGALSCSSGLAPKNQDVVLNAEAFGSCATILRTLLKISVSGSLYVPVGICHVQARSLFLWGKGNVAALLLWFIPYNFSDIHVFRLICRKSHQICLLALEIFLCSCAVPVVSGFMSSCLLILFNLVNFRLLTFPNDWQWRA